MAPVSTWLRLRVDDCWRHFEISWYLLMEFLLIMHKRPCGLKDEWIRIWWSKVTSKIFFYPRGQLCSWHHNVLQNTLFIQCHNSGTEEQMAIEFHWIDDTNLGCPPRNRADCRELLCYMCDESTFCDSLASLQQHPYLISPTQTHWFCWYCSSGDRHRTMTWNLFLSSILWQ